MTKRKKKICNLFKFYLNSVHILADHKYIFGFSVAFLFWQQMYNRLTELRIHKDLSAVWKRLHKYLPFLSEGCTEQTVKSTSVSNNISF